MPTICERVPYDCLSCGMKVTQDYLDEIVHPLDAFECAKERKCARCLFVAIGSSAGGSAPAAGRSQPEGG